MPTNMGVVLNVQDVDRSAEWYKGLGFRTKELNEGGIRHVEATLGDARVDLFPKESPWLDEDGKEWLRGPLGSGVVLFFEVANVNSVWKKVQESGATVDVPLDEQPWGARAFMVDDPDGYVLGFQQRERATTRRETASPVARKSGSKTTRGGVKQPAKRKADRSGKRRAR